MMIFSLASLIASIHGTALAAPALDLSALEGNYDSVTMAEWMKHDDAHRDGEKGTAITRFQRGVQLPGSDQDLERLRVTVPSGYASSRTRDFDFYRNQADELAFTAKKVSDSGKTEQVVVPMKQSGTTFSGGFSYVFFGKESKMGIVLELPDPNHIRITAKFSCCKVSMGHAGCLVTGMCDDTYTLSR